MSVQRRGRSVLPLKENMKMNWKKGVSALLLIAALGAGLSACGSGTPENVSSPSIPPAGSSAPAASAEPADNASGTLVVCFSCTGNTRSAAKAVAEAIGGTLYEITPAQPYTNADLNYNDSKSRTTAEQNDKSARPEISGTIENWEQYDTVFLGYPIWWGEEPRILDTFAESYDFTGKTVIPFCTSAASGIGQSGSNLAALALGNGTWLEGKRLDADASAKDISA